MVETKSEITDWKREGPDIVFEFKFKVKGVEKKPETRIGIIEFMTMTKEQRRKWTLDTVDLLRNAELWRGVEEVCDSMIGPVEVFQ